MNGMSLFCFDFSGSGKSAGPYCSLGHFEQDDLECAIQYLTNTSKVSKIAVWGRSMGAITALLYAKRDLRISCMILDSPFTNFKQLVKELAKQKASVPGFLTLAVFSVLKRSIKTKANFDIELIDPLSHVPFIKTPAMFGAAGGDTFVVPDHSRQLHDEYAGPKKLVIFEGDHNSERPLTFLFQVSEFLKEHMLKAPALPKEEAADTKEVKPIEESKPVIIQVPIKSNTDEVVKQESSELKTQKAKSDNLLANKALRPVEQAEPMKIAVNHIRKESQIPPKLQEKPCTPASPFEKGKPTFSWMNEHSSSTPELGKVNAINAPESQKLVAKPDAPQTSRHRDSIGSENSPNNPHCTPTRPKRGENGRYPTVVPFLLLSNGKKGDEPVVKTNLDSPSSNLHTGGNNYERNNLRHLTVSSLQDLNKEKGARRAPIFGRKDSQTLSSGNLLVHQKDSSPMYPARHASIHENQYKGSIKSAQSIFGVTKTSTGPQQVTIDLFTDNKSKSATIKPTQPKNLDNESIMTSVTSKVLNSMEVKKETAAHTPVKNTEKAPRPNAAMRALRENLNPNPAVKDGGQKRLFESDQKPKTILQFGNNTSFSDFSQNSSLLNNSAIHKDTKALVDSICSATPNGQDISRVLKPHNSQHIHINLTKTNAANLKETLASRGAATAKAVTPGGYSHYTSTKPATGSISQYQSRHATPIGSTNPTDRKEPTVQPVDFLSYYSVYTHQQSIQAKELQRKDSLGSLTRKLSAIDRSLSDANTLSTDLSGRNDRSFTQSGVTIFSTK